MQPSIATPPSLLDPRRHPPGERSCNPRRMISGCHPILTLYCATQVLIASTLCQWGSDLTAQVVRQWSLVRFQEVETQVQITIVLLFLFGRRYQPSVLAGVAKGKSLGRANGRLVGFAHLSSLQPFYAPVANYISILDLPALTTLLAYLCLPQSTSFFTDPCRRLTSPFPQCHDLLYSPPTYVMTFWILSALAYFTSLVLESFERGSLDWHGWLRSPSDVSIRNLLVYLLRNCGLVFALYVAFGEPESPMGLALFSPTICLGSWVISSLNGTILFILALLLRWGLCRLSIFSHLGRFSISVCHSFVNLKSYQKKSSPYRTALEFASATPSFPGTPTRNTGISLPVTPPRMISKAPKIPAFKRSPLTAYTFVPPPLLVCDGQLGTVGMNSPPVGLAEIAAIQLEEVGTSRASVGIFAPQAEDLFRLPTIFMGSTYFKLQFDVDDAVFGNVREAQESEPLKFVLKTTLPKMESPESESSEDDDFPLLRPSSRLGFNNDEVSSRWYNPKIYEGMESAAADLYRPTFHEICAKRLPPTMPETNSWEETSSVNAIPSPCNTPPRLQRSLSPLTPEVSSTSDDDGEGDWDAYSRSPTGSVYDWTKAATFLGEYREEYHGMEGEKKRVFHLARIPELYTIDEECTDDETKPDREV